MILKDIFEDNKIIYEYEYMNLKGNEIFNGDNIKNVKTINEKLEM
ncbi:6201_t:CDS:2 [Entrophospora sp. SA101]|nr:6201_t:CDS:2 [Entrophospora sp. SA101]